MSDHVRLGIFSPSVVLGVATATSALDDAGLTIETVPAASSAEQFAALYSGELDAALTSPDNVLAYRGSAANPLGRALDVRVLAAVDRGLGLSLFTAPGLDPDDPVDPDGLAGGVLGVDVPTSGFAFVGYELLARRGLRAGTDYEVRALGSTPRRARALLAGECTMTVLNAGNDLFAEAAGCARISRAASLGPYVGTVLAATGASVAASPTTLRALTDVLVQTSGTLFDGGLRSIAAAVTAARLGLGEPEVQRYLHTLSNPLEGLILDGRLDEGSLRTLCWLRDRHAAPGPARAARAALNALVEPSAGFVDDRFLTAPAT